MYTNNKSNQVEEYNNGWLCPRKSLVLDHKSRSLTINEIVRIHSNVWGYYRLTRMKNTCKHPYFPGKHARYTLKKTLLNEARLEGDAIV